MGVKWNFIQELHMTVLYAAFQSDIRLRALAHAYFEHKHNPTDILCQFKWFSNNFGYFLLYHVRVCIDSIQNIKTASFWLCVLIFLFSRK